MVRIAADQIPIWTKGSRHIHGEDARRTNILAFKVISEALKTSLGPSGLDKILMTIHGPRPQDVDTVVSNDGAEILKAVHVEHPVAKFATKVAEAQDKEIGDGTKTVIVIAGELLKNAEELLRMRIHPTIIVNGYEKAMLQACRTLEEISHPINVADIDSLKKVARASMSSKLIAGFEDSLADVVARAVKQVAREDTGGGWKVDIEDINVVRKEGGNIEDTRLIQGLVIDKQAINVHMPKKIKNCKIALLNKKLNALFFLQSNARAVKINITELGQVETYANRQREIIEKLVDKFFKAGANVLFCQQEIDNVFQQPFLSRGMVAFQQTLIDDMDRLVKATGARVIQDIQDFKPEDLGKADLFEQYKVGDMELVFIEGVEDPEAVGILVRGATDYVTREVKRVILNGLHAVKTVIENPRIVVGGGAAEIEIARKLKSYAYNFSGREQLAIRKFAESLECIPEALARNSGLDAIDIVTSLRREHDLGNGNAGVDVFDGGIADMKQGNGAWEPLTVKKQAIVGAFEAAATVLRVDDIFVKRQGPGGPLYVGDKKRAKKLAEEEAPEKY